MKKAALIPARYAATRFPAKLMQMLGSKTVIRHTYDNTVATGLFDEVIVETVGVGQSEIEIAGLADTTVVVMVPEGGDEVQTMKAGLMEIADIFVVNKADRPGADNFEKNLRMMLAPAFAKKQTKVEVVKTTATSRLGVEALYSKILSHLQTVHTTDKKYWLLADRAFMLIQQKKMRGITKKQLFEQIKMRTGNHFNLYAFVENYY